MLYDIKNGQTSVVLRVKLRSSSVSTGAGLTGLTNASSGLIISTIADNEATATAYTAAGSTVETVTTLGTYATPTATKCRFREVDATNHKGLYELHLADARFAVSGAKSLTVSFSGASGLAEGDVVVPLRAVDPYSATGFVTSVPSVVGSVGSVISGVTVTTNSDKTGYTVSTVSDKTGYSLASSQTFNITGNLSGSVGSVTGNVGGSVASVTAAVTLPSIPSNWITTAGINAAALNGKGDWSTTTPPTTSAIATAVWEDLHSNHTTSGSFGALVDATVSSRSTFAGGTVAAVAAGVTVTTNNDKTGYSLATAPPTAAQVAAAVLATPANMLATDASGRVLLQPTQTGVTIPTVTSVGNVSGSVGSVAANGITQSSYTSGVQVPANVLWFNGHTAVTDANNYPSVNIADVGGAAATAAGIVNANVTQIAGQTTSAAGSVAFPSSVGTSTYAGADTSGTTTLLGRLPGTLSVSSGKVAATVAAGDCADTAALKTTVGVAGAGLTGLGDARLANLDAAVSTRSTYAGADTSGTATLLARFTSARAGYLDQIPTTAGAVWDAATSAHTTSGTFGASLGSGASGSVTVAPGGITQASFNSSVVVPANVTQMNGQAVTSVAKVPATVAAGDGADAAALRTTVGAAGAGLTALGDARLANLDAAVSAVKAKTDNLPASPAAVGSAMALSSGERSALASAVWALADAVETGESPAAALRLLRAFAVGIASVSGDAVTFMRKDGTTPAVTVTKSPAGTGARTSSAVGTV